ncbi:hypothetical protein ACSBR2_025528 [Camellia fascicularis]
MGDDEEEACKCNTRLGLGIGVDEFTLPKCDRAKKKQVVCLELSIPPHMNQQAIDADYRIEGSSSKTTELDKCNIEKKKFNDNNDDSDSNNNNNNNCSRKKLRLTKEQSTLLEESFKFHSTLNPTQKQTLAKKLNLLPRQVEVWFQNRRARTKLKQTEVDCEFMKKCCERLSDENRRLKKEVEELKRSLKLEQQQRQNSLFIQLQKATALTMCPSCNKFTKVVAATTTTTINSTSTISANNDNKEKEAGAAIDVVT